MKSGTSLGVHSTADIGQNVSLGKGIVIGPHAIIYDNVTIGDDSAIGAQSIIYENVTIGEHSHIGPRVSIGEPTAELYSSDSYEGAPTYIGADAIIRSGSILYGGCEIGAYFHTGHYAVIRERTIVGHHVSFGTFAQSDGDCVLGNYVRLHYATHVCRTARVGNYVWIFPYTVLTNDIHPPCMLCVEGPTIEDYVVVATHSVIMPRVKIGTHALIGANSVVTKDVPRESIAIGSPAKIVGLVSSLTCDFGDRVPTPYPWPTHFVDGYPWEENGWQAEQD